MLTGHTMKEFFSQNERIANYYQALIDIFGDIFFFNLVTRDFHNSENRNGKYLRKL